MEMEAVADIFDRDGDGFIDYKEFVSALRPDREVKPCTHCSRFAKSRIETKNVSFPFVSHLLEQSLNSLLQLHLEIP